MRGKVKRKYEDAGGILQKAAGAAPLFGAAPVIKGESASHRRTGRRWKANGQATACFLRSRTYCQTMARAASAVPATDGSVSGSTHSRPIATKAARTGILRL